MDKGIEVMVRCIVVVIRIGKWRNAKTCECGVQECPSREQDKGWPWRGREACVRSTIIRSWHSHSLMSSSIRRARNRQSFYSCHLNSHFSVYSEESVSKTLWMCNSFVCIEYGHSFNLALKDFQYNQDSLKIFKMQIINSPLLALFTFRD